MTNVIKELHSFFSPFTVALILRYLRHKVEEQMRKIRDDHTRKLRDLGVNNDLSPCNPDKTVLNYSSVSLSPSLKTLLAFGLDFCLPVFNLNFYNYFYKFEVLYNNLSYRHQNQCISLNVFKSDLQVIARKYFYSFNPFGYAYQEILR